MCKIYKTLLTKFSVSKVVSVPVIQSNRILLYHGMRNDHSTLITLTHPSTYNDSQDTQVLQKYFGEFIPCFIVLKGRFHVDTSEPLQCTNGPSSHVVVCNLYVNSSVLCVLPQYLIPCLPGTTCWYNTYHFKMLTLLTFSSFLFTQSTCTQSLLDHLSQWHCTFTLLCSFH